MKKALLYVALAASWVSGSAYAAVAQTWTLIDSNCTSGCPGGSSIRTYTSNQGGVLTAQALYVRNSDLNNEFRRAESAGGMNALLTTQDPNGIGLSNPRSGDSEWTSPNHAIDNIVNRDFVLLDFGKVTPMNSFSVGWIGGDSDISILFAPTNWNMATTPIFNTGDGTSNGTSINDLIGANWSQLNFNNVAANSTVNFGKGTKSRYALVSGALASAYTGNDAFKLKTFTAPTPGTLALLGLGLGAIVWFRRGRPSQLAMSPA
jgi:hypothetical protein